MFDSSLRDFSSVVFDDGLVIVDPTSGLLAVLNASGRLVWEYLAGGASVDETASRLARHYRIPASLARQGVDTLRAQLSDQGFGSEGAYRPRTKGNKFPLGADPREAIQPLAGTLGPAASCAAAYTYALRRHEAFRLVYTTNTLEEQLHPAFAHLEVTDVAPSHTLTFGRQDDDYFLLYDGALIERTAVLEDAYGELLGSVLNLSYPGVEWLAFLHTGAVSDGERAILFPAESGAGKSTLVAALADAGLRYMGDDTIPIQRGTLLATPLPLSLRIKEGSWSLLEESYPELAALPVRESRGRKVRYLRPPSPEAHKASPMPVASLVFPARQAGASVELTALSPTDALRRLIEAGAWLGEPLDTCKVAELLEWIQSTRRYELHYDSLKPAVAAIKHLLSQ